MKTTVKELIEKLKRFDEDAVVVLFNDDNEILLDFPLNIKEATLKKGEFINSYYTYSGKKKDKMIKSVLIKY